MATIQKSDITPFAEKVFDENQEQIKQNYVDSLSARLLKSIKDGEQYIKTGEPLQTLDEHLEFVDSLKA